MVTTTRNLSREQRLAALPRETDLLVIGGGITGAGIALEAARRGVRVVLIEARDFAWGTSSRSSKLVHGGLRYLKEGKPALTLESVRERNQLMREIPGLVDPMGFVMAHHAGHKPRRNTMRVGLALYDAFAGKRSSGWASVADLQFLAPGIAPDGLDGASLYLDATTDDARLVLRVIAEAQRAGACAINYLPAHSLLRNAEGEVCGARLRCAETGIDIDVQAACTIAATGVWADQLRASLGQTPKLRPLRGSHLLLPAWRLPLARAVAFLHPTDRRPIFAYPWEGTTLIGTTDLDHDGIDQEPAITTAEVHYLLDALNQCFPGLSATPADVLSTWAGVRPVVDSGKALAPSQESRDHIVLQEQGLISVTGGKLTTFRRIAQDTLRHAAPRLPMLRLASDHTIIPQCPPPANIERLPSHLRERLLGRLGSALDEMLHAASTEDLMPVAETRTLWAELHWALRHEQVAHLDDLLLRRTRLGLTLREGAIELLPRLKVGCQSELGWSDARWQDECDRYRALIARCYALPAELK